MRDTPRCLSIELAGSLSRPGTRPASWCEPIQDNGGVATLLQVGIAETMVALRRGKLLLPRRRQETEVPVTRLAAIGSRGLGDRDVNGDPHKQPPRGPFDILPPLGEGVPTYPALWAHSAKRQRHLIVEPDSRAEVRPGCEDRAIHAWDQSSTRLLFNRNFRMTSQSLAACLTQHKTLGGQAWVNFKLDQPAWNAVMALWANTTLGIMSFWWLGSRQQEGRPRVTPSRLPSLQVLDPRKLSREQVAAADAFLDGFKPRAFLPANEAYRDETRQALDRAVLVDLLGLPEDVMEPLDLLRKQWCAEPTVHGGKSTRPP